MNRVRTTARREDKHLSFVIWCVLYKSFDGIFINKVSSFSWTRHMHMPYICECIRNIHGGTMVCSATSCNKCRFYKWSFVLSCRTIYYTCPAWWPIPNEMWFCAKQQQIKFTVKDDNGRCVSYIEWDSSIANAIIWLVSHQHLLPLFKDYPQQWWGGFVGSSMHL